MTLEEITLSEITRRPLSEVRALQDRLLQQTVALCYDLHPFYGRLMRRERLRPDHIQTVEDLQRLPPTSKTDFLAAPEDFRLDPRRLGPEFGTLDKVIYTSGTTTGRPAPLSITTFDRAAFMYDIARRREILDFGHGDMLANLFPLTPFPMGAYARAGDEAAALGASHLVTHPGRDGGVFPLRRRLDEVVQMVSSHRATVLWGVAGFVRRILIRAGELDVDFKAVRIAMITGEATSAAMRDDMSGRMRALGCAGDRIINRYGSTEMGASMIECAGGSGFHDLSPDQLTYEVLSPDNKRLADGETGDLAFTHLLRRGTVFLRYKVGDVGAISRNPCPMCGRTSLRLTSNPVRTGDIVKIRGMLVNLQVMKDRLEQMPMISEYQIVVQPQSPGDPFSADELLLRLALTSGDVETVSALLIGETIALTQVSPRLEFVSSNDIYDPMTDPKPRRVRDLRLQSSALT